MDALRTREAAGVGLTAARLRGPGWRRVSHGLYVPSAAAADLRSICGAYRRVLPTGAVFGELTAATLYGWWLPPLPRSIPVCAAVPPDAVPPRRQGLRIRRTALGAGERRVTAGLPVTSPVRTLLDLSATLSTVDLVVVIDSAVRLGHCTAVELAAACDRTGVRGIRTLRRAVGMADPRSESPWETLLRLLHVLSGLPEVWPQVNLTDATGRWVARADLWLVGTRRIHEYDGAGHRDREQHRKDLAREKRLARAGFERYGYTAPEILGRPEQVIRDAERAFGLPPDPRHLRAWLRHVEQSLFSRAGRERLDRAWRLG